MENSIEENIKILEEFKTHGYAMLLMKYEDRNKTNLKIDQAIEHILSDYKKVLKENDCLKNHVHYKYCIACGKEFRTKRSDTKYCSYCSKSVTNKIYFANLTEEQKEKRRQQSKLAMRKLREKNK